MRLERVEITNFKLLETVVLEFSTDRQRPLTALRAENGSGKTSLLLAMLWGFYGRGGLPKFATKARLTSAAQPIGTAVPVRVMIEFEHEGPGGRGRYRLIRSCEETPVGIDEVQRVAERVAAYQITDAGEEPIDNPDVFLRQVVPNNLRDIFFTNGDDVQEFMSGKVDRADRQGRVHLAIKALLGLDQLYLARNDIGEAERRFRRELSKDGGSDLATAATAVEQAENKNDQIEKEIGELEDEISRIRDKRDAWERQLLEITDIGDLNQINAALAGVEAELNQYELDRAKALRAIREELSSERLSWALLPEPLEKGMTVLESLADRGLIPGTSIEVIRDRLDEGVCFCGTPLDSGSPARERLEHLLSDHAQIDRSKELLTAAYHGARFQKSQHDADLTNGVGFSERRRENVGALADLGNLITSRQGRRSVLLEQRSRIDETRVKTLTDDISRANADLAKRDREQAVHKHEFEIAKADLETTKDEFRKLEKGKLVGRSKIERDGGR